MNAPGQGDTGGGGCQDFRFLPSFVLRRAPRSCRLKVCVWLKPWCLSPQRPMKSVTLHLRKHLPQWGPRATSSWGPGKESPSIATQTSVTGRLGQARSLLGHDATNFKCCHHHEAKRVGMGPRLRKVLTRPTVSVFLLPYFSVSLRLSKIRTGKAQQNKAIYFHKIYHPLKGPQWPVYYLRLVGIHPPLPHSHPRQPGIGEGGRVGGRVRGEARPGFDISLITYCTIRSI